MSLTMTFGSGIFWPLEQDPHLPSPGTRCYRLEGPVPSKIQRYKTQNGWRKLSDKTKLCRLVINRFYFCFAGDNTKQISNVANLRTAFFQGVQINHREKKNNGMLSKIRYFIMGNCIVICFSLLQIPDRRKWNKIACICFAQKNHIKDKSITRKHLTIPEKKVIKFLTTGQDSNKGHLLNF